MTLFLRKYISALILLMVGCTLVEGQGVIINGKFEPQVFKNQNEIQINLFAPLPFKAISLEYERVVHLDVGVGFMACTYLGKDRFNVVFFPTAGVMPFGRWYFGGRWLAMSKPNTGFFLEANSSIGYNDKLRNVYYGGNFYNIERTEEEVSGISWGIGLGAGFKLVSKHNWSGEVACRLGHNLIQASEWNLFYIYPAISVGYRF